MFSEYQLACQKEVSIWSFRTIWLVSTKQTERSRSVTFSQSFGPSAGHETQTQYRSLTLGKKRKTSQCGKDKSRRRNLPWYPTNRSRVLAGLSKMNDLPTPSNVKSMHLGAEPVWPVYVLQGRSPQVWQERAASIRTCCVHRLATSCYSRTH